MFEPPYHAVERCPHCETILANVQGVTTCPECRWSDVEGRLASA